MATAVVTGGCGFVGSHLVERLAARGDDVVVCDVAPPPPDSAADPARVRYVAADVRDADALAAMITPGVGVVYHLSAMVGVDQYLDSPLDVIDVAVTGTGNVLRLAAAAGAKVVLTSTSEIYGKNPQPPWAEDSDRVLGSTAADRWCYSSSKAVAEHMAFAYARSGLPIAILRYFNVYGPRQRPAYVVSKTIHRVLRGLPPYLYDGGGQTRCFTFVADAVAATLAAADSPAADGEAINVGSDRETTIRDAVRLATRLAGSSAQPVDVATRAEFGASYEDIPRRIPDVSKARRLLGWRAETPLREGLAATINWASASDWWLEAAAMADAAGDLPDPVPA